MKNSQTKKIISASEFSEKLEVLQSVGFDGKSAKAQILKNFRLQTKKEAEQAEKLQGLNYYSVSGLVQAVASVIYNATGYAHKLPASLSDDSDNLIIDADEVFNFLKDKRIKNTEKKQFVVAENFPNVAGIKIMIPINIIPSKISAENYKIVRSCIAEKTK